MTDKQPIYAELPADRYSKSGNVTDTGWYNIHDLRAFADATHALRTQALAAQAPVTDLQNVHDAVTVDLLNERVAYLEAKLKEAQAPQQAAPAVGNSGFDHRTAASILDGKAVSDEYIRKFVQASRRAHDDRASLQATLQSVRNELASREAEIALLKKALMDAETAPQQEVQEPCQTCAALARTVMLDQISFDRKPDAYGILQITDDEGVEKWEDIRTSPDVAREEANDMMATGRGEMYEVVPLWTTPQPAPSGDAEAEDAARLDWLLLHISGAEFRRIGVHYSDNARRADVDAARKEGNKP